MSKTSFKKFVEQEKAVDSKQRNIDWEGKKRTYLQRVGALFDEIRAYLQEFVESEDLQIKESTETIDEEYIGEYEVPVLRIQLFDKHADLVPAGTRIIGSPGRVDLVGDFDKKSFILADREEDRPQIFSGFSWHSNGKRVKKKADKETRRKRHYVWKLLTDPPKMRYVELDEDIFLSSLQEVLDG